MMTRKRLLALVAPLALIGGSLIVVAALADDDEINRPLPAAIPNLAEAKRVEIKDQAGQTLLSGSFADTTETDGDLERVARLTPAGADADAAGEVEIEIPAGNPAGRKMELSVERLAPAAAFALFVDGVEAATFTTDREGEAELEFGDEPAK